MATTLAPNETFFDKVDRNFTDVPVDKAKGNAIPTAEFLEACDGLVLYFKLLNVATLNFVSMDISNNIKKLRTRLAQFPNESKTLQDILEDEKKQKKKHAKDALTWLNRTLNFTAKAVRDNVANPSKELAESFKEIYPKTLGKNHGPLGRASFGIGMMGIPYRKDFYKLAGDDQARLQAWLDAMLRLVNIIKNELGDFDEEDKKLMQERKLTLLPTPA